MDIKAFNTLVDNPLELSFQDKVLVQEECGRAPYSAVLKLLDILCSKACNIAVGKMDSVQTTLLYLPEDNTLNSLLEKARLKEAITTSNISVVETKGQNVEPAQQESQDTGDILKEINDYQEISFKTAPKSVILDKFLESAVYNKTDNSPIDPVAVSESGKKSIRPDDSLSTETLAHILEQQGKFEKAAEVYRNLSLQNPEKSSIFARRIEELERKIADSR